MTTQTKSQQLAEWLTLKAIDHSKNDEAASHILKQDKALTAAHEALESMRETYPYVTLHHTATQLP
jgi:hypothetical protein